MEPKFSTKIHIAVCLAMLFAVYTGNAENKPTVAVLDFESIGSQEYLGKAVAEIMRTELVGTQQFRVVERAQIRKALSEQELQMSGVIDDRSAVELGKFLGADLIVVGSVVKIGTAYTINSRMIDVKTGEAKLGRNVSGNDLNLLTNLTRTLISGFLGTEEKEPPPAAATAPAEAATDTDPTVPPQTLEATQVTWDFETGDLTGWEQTGDAFLHQPTYGDNPTARRRGQPSRHEGDYWIGGYERRPRPFDRPGATQGDSPQGTLTSSPFVITTSGIGFLLGGGCDMTTVRAELVVDGRVVRSSTGKCHESMNRVYWDVFQIPGEMGARTTGGCFGRRAGDISILMTSGSLTWKGPPKPWNPNQGKKPAPSPFRLPLPRVSVGISRTRGCPDGKKRAMHLPISPLMGTTRRRAGVDNRPIMKATIGSADTRSGRGPSDPSGAVQGDRPQGTLVSDPFTITGPKIRFLIGGGCDESKVRMELTVGGRVVRKATGKCNETMQSMQWDVRPFLGQTAQIRIVDLSSGGWGHINIDDIRFE